MSLNPDVIEVSEFNNGISVQLNYLYLFFGDSIILIWIAKSICEEMFKKMKQKRIILK